LFWKGDLLPYLNHILTGARCQLINLDGWEPIAPNLRQVEEFRECLRQFSNNFNYEVLVLDECQNHLEFVQQFIKVN